MGFTLADTVLCSIEALSWAGVGGMWVSVLFEKNMTQYIERHLGFLLMAQSPLRFNQNYQQTGILES